MIFRQLFDPETSTYTYLLADEESREAVLIDPVLEQVDRDLEIIEELGLKLVYAMDTHVHADHVTGMGTLRERTGCKTVLSERAGTGCADLLVKDGDRLKFGKYEIEVRETPGHTDGCLSYVVEEPHPMVFTGDALLIRGSGRTDFQQGDAHKLYRSIHDKVYTLPDHTLIYPGHDYKGRTVSTVGEEKKFNRRLKLGISEEEFVRIMEELQLPRPKKIDEALPANLACGVPKGLPVTPEEQADTSWAPVERSAAGIAEVAPEWVASHAAAVRVIDVRGEDEYRGELGHVPGSELVHLDTLEGVAPAWSKDERLVMICRSGGRSGKATVLLESLGFRRVASMRGGMEAWNERRYPVER